MRILFTILEIFSRFSKGTQCYYYKNLSSSHQFTQARLNTAEQMHQFHSFKQTQITDPAFMTASSMLSNSLKLLLKSHHLKIRATNATGFWLRLSTVMLSLLSSHPRSNQEIFFNWSVDTTLILLCGKTLTLKRALPPMIAWRAKSVIQGDWPGHTSVHSVELTWNKNTCNCPAESINTEVASSAQH